LSCQRNDETADVTYSPGSRRQITRDEAWYRGAADPETFGLITWGLEDMTEHGLEDPVLQGVITAGQAEVAYQMYGCLQVWY
jgi:hypothetical protein